MLKPMHCSDNTRKKQQRFSGTNRVRPNTPLATQIELRLREMAMAYVGMEVQFVDFGIRTVQLRLLTRNLQIRKTRLFALTGNTLRFLDKTSNITKPFVKVETPQKKYFINGQRVM